MDVILILLFFFKEHNFKKGQLLSWIPVAGHSENWYSNYEQIITLNYLCE